MTTDEIVNRWAEAKWGLTDVVEVRFEHYEGFGGSDVTPAEPEEHMVCLLLADGTHRTYGDVWLTTDLINEILAAARDDGGT